MMADSIDKVLKDTGFNKNSRLHQTIQRKRIAQTPKFLVSLPLQDNEQICGITLGYHGRGLYSDRAAEITPFIEISAILVWVPPTFVK